MIDWVIDAARDGGAGDIKVVVNPHHAEVAAHLDGKVEVVATSATTPYFSVTGHSKSGTDFTITRTDTGYIRCMTAAPCSGTSTW